MLKPRPDGVRPAPLKFKADGNILYAQAFGAWLYLQIGSLGLFFGQRCRRGLRIVWDRPTPRVKWCRFYA